MKPNAADLFVHPWTFRDDHVDPNFEGKIEAEMKTYLALGVDGLFTDFPDTGVKVRNVASKPLSP